MVINSTLIVTVRFWVFLPLGIFTNWHVIGVWMLAYAGFEGLEALFSCRHLKRHKTLRDQVFPEDEDDPEGSFLTIPTYVLFGFIRFVGGCFWIALIAGIGWCIRFLVSKFI